MHVKFELAALLADDLAHFCVHLKARDAVYHVRAGVL